MKKKIVQFFAGNMILSMLVIGCSGNDNKVSNEYLTLEGYKGIEVADVPDISGVTDEEVDSYIDSILMQNAVEITDRGVEIGDKVDINYAGTVDGEEFSGGNEENMQLEVGAEQFLEGFDEGLVGHNAGDIYEWIGVLPENYANNPELSEREAVYIVTVNTITRPAELTDDFVQTVSEKSKTVEEYREEIKKILEDNLVIDKESALQEAVWNAVLEKVEVEKYPEDEVKRISEPLIQQYKDAAKSEGIDYESYIQEHMGISAEDFENQAKEAAKSDIKQQLTAELIGDKENLIPDEDGMEKEYQKLAEEYGYQDVEALKGAADEDTLNSLIIQKLVKQWLADNCKQVDK